MLRWDDMVRQRGPDRDNTLFFFSSYLRCQHKRVADPATNTHIKGRKEGQTDGMRILSDFEVFWGLLCSQKFWLSQENLSWFFNLLFIAKIDRKVFVFFWGDSIRGGYQVEDNLGSSLLNSKVNLLDTLVSKTQVEERESFWWGRF